MTAKSSKRPRQPRVPKSPARARAEASTKVRADRPPGWLFPGEQTASEQRIERIVDLMLAGDWWPGRSHKALALEWGCAVQTVMNLSAEAHRHVRQLAADVPDMRDVLLGMARDLYGRCLDAKRVELRQAKKGEPKALVEIPAPDLPSARASLELIAKIAGVMTTKVEVASRDPFEGWTDEEKRTFAETGQWPDRRRSPGPDD